MFHCPFHTLKLQIEDMVEKIGNEKIGENEICVFESIFLEECLDLPDLLDSLPVAPAVVYGTNGIADERQNTVRLEVDERILLRIVERENLTQGGRTEPLNRGTEIIPSLITRKILIEQLTQ